MFPGGVRFFFEFFKATFVFERVNVVRERGFFFVYFFLFHRARGSGCQNSIRLIVRVWSSFCQLLVVCFLIFMLTKYRSHIFLVLLSLLAFPVVRADFWLERA